LQAGVEATGPLAGANHNGCTRCRLGLRIGSAVAHWSSCANTGRVRWLSGMTVFAIAFDLMPLIQYGTLRISITSFRG
jgi:hypothetical protein